MIRSREDLAPVYFFAVALIIAVTVLMASSAGDWVVREEGGTPAACFAYLGHCAEVWTAIGTVGLYIATIILVAVGLYQAVEIRREAKLDRTLSASERYFYDPVVDVSLRNLREYRRAWDNPGIYRVDIQVVLSQLDGLAYGIELLIYDEDYVREGMQSVFAHHIVMHADPVVVERFELDLDNFLALSRLDRHWSAYSPYLASKARSKAFALRLTAQGEWGTSPQTEGAPT